jgi:hypothetical protein
MPRDKDHLELPRWSGTFPRRKRPGGRTPQREDKQAHGVQLLAQAEETANRLRERETERHSGVNPKLIFKLVLHPEGKLDTEQLRQLGLQLLGIDTRHALVVFPDHARLDELRRRLREYAGLVPDGHDYAYLSAIESIEELTSQDRTGTGLAANPLGQDSVESLDVELWHTGDTEECRLNIGQIRDYLEGLGLEVTDDYIGASLCLIRARLNTAALAVLLSGNRFDFVKEVDRRAQPTFDLAEVTSIALDELEGLGSSAPLPEGVIGIVILDSGVAQLHPLLAPALGDAQVFADRLAAKVQGGPEDGDFHDGGHGTAVSGIAIYGDVGACLAKREFTPSARLFSARITDDKNEYDEEELLEHQLQTAIEYFVSNYPEARVVNISLGNKNSVYSDDKYQFRFAAAIDEIAYKYRDRNIVFVVAAGNYRSAIEDNDDLIDHYPDYLLDNESARVIDPATSALSLTVGGLSYGAGRDYRIPEGRTDRLVAGRMDWPSPFTRTGWGFAGSVKPDVVDYAGDLRYERGRIPDKPAYAGLPTTSKNFGPPEGRLFRTVSGTSYSAPRVANLAARLMQEFPEASSNLIRALIIDSARVPVDRPPQLCRVDTGDERILRLYGHGKPDFERARWSGENGVLLLADDSIGLDTFELFLIPSLPESFFASQGTGFISVSLVFDPPTRHTRADSYLGVTMGFDLFRNIAPERVADVLKAWDRDDVKEMEDLPIPSLGTLRGDLNEPARVSLKPLAKRRNIGTAQRALVKVSNRAWRYNGQELVLAVICQRKWAPSDITHQRYALVVSVFHENSDVDLYTQIRQRARQFQRVQVRV